ncbi:MAG: ABC transporter ATP-binding protein [candidate division NC10 bacterium]|nr:ABC transporter ATP-binding protein [candidate division NC10 bacterium]
MKDTIESLRFRITKRFGTKTVLKDFGLEVRGRQFITFLGPSGCGKSTALNILAGLIPATDGDVWIDGERIDHLPPEKRGFGMVFQNYALFPHMTVYSNIAFGLQLQRRPAAEIRERVGQMLDLVQLPGFEERYPSQLSGGQQQRIAIARALVLHPRLLLLDEPLSNLDAKLRIEMRAEIKRLHTNLGLTSIYVTHDQTEALSLSDWVVVMRDGILMQAGTAQEIHDQPRNVFVADFMGFRNFFPVQVASVGPEGVVEGTGNGMRIRGRTRHALGPGAAAVAAIRPDDVQVGEHLGGPNAFHGKVDIVEYLGRENEVILTLEAGPRLWVHTPERVVPGESVMVVFPPEKVIFLPPDGEGVSA